ncbi:glucarate dehydratase family protein [Deinococcus marmoris]|uniref:glucarate dehydratase n=1 Tax=Deinococcus marmoris TaxID=249408 RepID=A0A1U7NUW2_9DEIO|nr:glucarate dehydratase family protein [Deinococcus marmoris]OLV16695.1 Glucarate dehydratase [Deinococcus marmoris]
MKDTISAVRVTPIAFRDPPLLNAAGIHEPYALRSIIELETASGLIGLGESYGDADTLADLERVAPALIGLDPFLLNELTRRVESLTVNRADTGLNLAPGTHGDKVTMRVVSAFEVACHDLMGQLTGRPVHELLGGKVRDSVPYSAYLFFKYAEHLNSPYQKDDWGEALTPAQVVAQAQRMIGEYGFHSIKLKGGALEPGIEADTVRALAAAFPGMPLRIDPNANWSVDLAVELGEELGSLLEYYEDPTPTLEGMAELHRRTGLPLATNMVVTSAAEFKRNATLNGVQVVLSDHHYWGGLRATQQLAAMCGTFGLGLSMHSNSHLGISLMAMTHLAASVPNLTYACDTHYPWQDEEVVAGGRIKFENGGLKVPDAPGLGVTLDRDALERLHQQYLTCGIRRRDDAGQMRRYDPAFEGLTPRFTARAKV